VEQSKGSLWAGVGVTLVLHLLVQVPAFFLLGLIVPGEKGLDLAFIPLMYIGLSQLVYMIPAILILRRRGDTETARGLIVGAALTFLLNATCSGLFLWS
jgi:ABC-type Fe3+-siderophore transport system permease subunit